MNVLNLTHSLDITSVSGQTLSTEEIYIVQNALLLLQSENNFKETYFMGKIFGIEKDYYIAFGFRLDAIRGRSFFYSNNGRDWFVLSDPSPSSLKLAPRVLQRFKGDPCHITDCKEAGEVLSAACSDCYLKEEDRLAAVVFTLHDDCAIAPKGAFFNNVDGLMEINPTFQGLSLKQGLSPEQWTHTRKGKFLPKSSGDFVKVTDLLTDVWAFRIRAQGSVSIVLNMHWLGLTVYHRLRTPEHGFVYFGEGLKTRTNSTG